MASKTESYHGQACSSFGIEIDLKCEETLSDYEDDKNGTGVCVDAENLKTFESKTRLVNISDHFTCDHCVNVECFGKCTKKLLLRLEDSDLVHGTFCSSLEDLGSDDDGDVDSEKLTRIKPKPPAVKNTNDMNGKSDVKGPLESGQIENVEKDSQETADDDDAASTVLSQLSISDDNHVHSQELPDPDFKG